MAQRTNLSRLRPNRSHVPAQHLSQFRHYPKKKPYRPQTVRASRTPQEKGRVERRGSGDRLEKDKAGLLILFSAVAQKPNDALPIFGMIPDGIVHGALDGNHLAFSLPVIGQIDAVTYRDNLIHSRQQK